MVAGQRNVVLFLHRVEVPRQCKYVVLIAVAPLMFQYLLVILHRVDANCWSPCNVVWHLGTAHVSGT
jgi:hypothetical protein